MAEKRNYKQTTIRSLGFMTLIVAVWLSGRFGNRVVLKSKDAEIESLQRRNADLQEMMQETKRRLQEWEESDALRGQQIEQNREVLTLLRKRSVERQQRIDEAMNKLRDLQARLDLPIVVDVIAGDELVVMENRKRRRVEVAGIDCPVADEPYAKKATAFTSAFCYGLRVSLEGRSEQDSKIRAIVVAKKRSLSESLLEAGLAKLESDVPSDSELFAIERSAREKKIGIWAE